MLEDTFVREPNADYVTAEQKLLRQLCKQAVSLPIGE